MPAPGSVRAIPECGDALFDRRVRGEKRRPARRAVDAARLEGGRHFARLHAAQAEEFQLLVELFREHPESFWQRNKRPAYSWDQQTFLNALDNCYLIPQADPNTASQTQRMMKIVGLKQLQQASPSMYDPVAIDTAALQAMGWNNPEQFMVPPSAMGKPPPELLRQQAEIQPWAAWREPRRVLQ